ncbi:hypothetical protein P148_SR1C00001G0324 [candidate division SR1 bacterium RAAC1_SR1_1]|nr:hypothetical protein P148_SR1C00001G0324 [candidate division SR1 bacterium RAAC1_SR1_1]
MEQLTHKNHLKKVVRTPIIVSGNQEALSDVLEYAHKKAKKRDIYAVKEGNALNHTHMLSYKELKEMLAEPEERIDAPQENIEKSEDQTIDVSSKKENKNSMSSKLNVVKRIKDWKEDIEESFKESLTDMLDAKIITKEQKEEVEESLKSPEVMESIRTWISVFGFSTLYIGVNTVTVTPLAGLLGGAGMGAIAYLLLYLLKRFLVSGIVSTVGKNLERKNYISNMSIIPVLGEQITLIELYRKFPLAAQLFYASMRTKKLRKEYNEHDDSTGKTNHQKEILREKWEKKVRKNADWIKRKSDGLVKFETSIGKFFIKLKDNVVSVFAE